MPKKVASPSSSPNAVPILNATPIAASVSIDASQAAFTVPQAALYLGLSHWQVRMAIWQGKLFARRVGKSLVILRSDADAFLESLPKVDANTSDWIAQRNTVPAMQRPLPSPPLIEPVVSPKAALQRRSRSGEW